MLCLGIQHGGGLGIPSWQCDEVACKNCMCCPVFQKCSKFENYKTRFFQLPRASASFREAGFSEKLGFSSFRELPRASAKSVFQKTRFFQLPRASAKWLFQKKLVFPASASFRELPRSDFFRKTRFFQLLRASASLRG